MTRPGQEHVGSKEKWVVRRKRGYQKRFRDCLSSNVHLSCPARCKGRWRWEGENRGFVRGQPQALAVPWQGGTSWEQAVPGQSWGRAEHPSRDGTAEGPSDRRPHQKVQMLTDGLMGKRPAPGFGSGPGELRTAPGPEPDGQRAKMRGCGEPSRRACSELSAVVRNVLGTCHRWAGTARYRHGGHGGINANPSGQRSSRRPTADSAARGPGEPPRPSVPAGARAGTVIGGTQRAGAVGGDRTVGRGRDSPPPRPE